MERTIHGIRLCKYCELHGRNEEGGEIYVLPAKPDSIGVKCYKNGFRGYVELRRANSFCLGPVRSEASTARKDFEQLQQWCEAMPPQAAIERVRAWKGASVSRRKKGGLRDKVVKPGRVGPGTCQDFQSQNNGPISQNTKHMP